MWHKRIFILDDEPDMLKIAGDLLESEGFVVITESSPIAALKKIRETPPDLLILDIRLPEMDGFQVCKEIKADSKVRHVPIVIISVKSAETDTVVGLELGADDYITKPYRKREMVARIKNVLLRRAGGPEPQIVEIRGLRIDYGGYLCTYNKNPVHLTPKEFELLGFFMRREGRVLTRSVISEAVWGFEHTGSSRTIDVHVDQLRRKLGYCESWIKSLKGIGYRFEVDE